MWLPIYSEEVKSRLERANIVVHPFKKCNCPSNRGVGRVKVEAFGAVVDYSTDPPTMVEKPPYRMKRPAKINGKWYELG
jgi:hypothetical protein